MDAITSLIEEPRVVVVISVPDGMYEEVALFEPRTAILDRSQVTRSPRLSKSGLLVQLTNTNTAWQMYMENTSAG